MTMMMTRTTTTTTRSPRLVVARSLALVVVFFFAFGACLVVGGARAVAAVRRRWRHLSGHYCEPAPSTARCCRLSQCGRRYLARPPLSNRIINQGILPLSRLSGSWWNYPLLSRRACDRMCGAARMNRPPSVPHGRAKAIVGGTGLRRGPLAAIAARARLLTGSRPQMRRHCKK